MSLEKPDLRKPLQQLRVLLLCSSKSEYICGNSKLAFHTKKLLTGDLVRKISLPLLIRHWPWLKMSCPLLPQCQPTQICVTQLRPASLSLIDSLLPRKSILLAFELPLWRLELIFDFSTKYGSPSKALRCLSVALTTSLLCTHQTGKISFRPYYPCLSLTASTLLNHLQQLTTATLEINFPAKSNF